MNPFTSLFYLATISAAIQKLFSSSLAFIQQLFASYLEAI